MLWAPWPDSELVVSDVWSLVAPSLSGAQPGHRRGGWGLAVSRYGAPSGRGEERRQACHEADLVGSHCAQQGRPLNPQPFCRVPLWQDLGRLWEQEPWMS